MFTIPCHGWLMTWWVVYDSQFYPHGISDLALHLQQYSKIFQRSLHHFHLGASFAHLSWTQRGCCLRQSSDAKIGGGICQWVCSDPAYGGPTMLSSAREDVCELLTDVNKLCSDILASTFWISLASTSVWPLVKTLMCLQWLFLLIFSVWDLRHSQSMESTWVKSINVPCAIQSFQESWSDAWPKLDPDTPVVLWLAKSPFYRHQSYAIGKMCFSMLFMHGWVCVCLFNQEQLGHTHSSLEVYHHPMYCMSYQTSSNFRQTKPYFTNQKWCADLESNSERLFLPFSTESVCATREGFWSIYREEP